MSSPQLEGVRRPHEGSILGRLCGTWLVASICSQKMPRRLTTTRVLRTVSSASTWDPDSFDGAKIAELLRFNAWDDCLVTLLAMGGTCAVPHFCGLRTFRRGGPRWLTPKVWAVEAGWRTVVRPQCGVFRGHVHRDMARIRCIVAACLDHYTHVCQTHVKTTTTTSVTILAQVATSDQACSNTVSCSVTEILGVGLLTKW